MSGMGGFAHHRGKAFPPETSVDTSTPASIGFRYNYRRLIMSTHDNEKNIAVSPDVLEQAMRQAEAEGKTVDELAQEAIKRHLAQKSLDRLKREAEARRGNKTDEEVEAIVDRAVKESRNENRSR